MIREHLLRNLTRITEFDAIGTSDQGSSKSLLKIANPKAQNLTEACAAAQTRPSTPRPPFCTNNRITLHLSTHNCGTGYVADTHASPRPLAPIDCGLPGCGLAYPRMPWACRPEVEQVCCFGFDCLCIMQPSLAKPPARLLSSWKFQATVTSRHSRLVTTHTEIPGKKTAQDAYARPPDFNFTHPIP